MALTRDEIMDLGAKYSRYFAGMAARDLYVKMKTPPLFELGQDSSAWTGERNGRQVVHIGLGLLCTNIDGTPVCETEAEFLSGMRFLVGHETGHQKYTTDRAFSGAIQTGTIELAEYAVRKYTGKSARLSKESDYQAALGDLARNRDIYISMEAVHECMHFIANSIEDSRMERRCIAEKPGFGLDVAWWRGNWWLHSPCRKDINLNDDAQYLAVLMDQLLRYATCGVWQKGFTECLSGTKVETRMRQLQPKIKEAVTARSCAKGMRIAKDIMVDLFPEILAAYEVKGVNNIMNDFFGACVLVIPDFDPQNANPHSYSQTVKEDAEEETKGSSGKSSGQEGEEGKSMSPDTSGEDSINIFKRGEKDEKPEKAPGSGSIGQSYDGPGEDLSAEIEEAMKEAAEGIAEAAEAAGMEVEIYSQGASVKEQEDEEGVAILLGDALHDICPDYREFFRKYELTEELPYDVLQECSVMRHQYEKYFESRKKRSVKNQRSGKLDPRQLHRFVRGDTDIYKRTGGVDHSFSGCIEVLLDNSGSMAGDKKMWACDALSRIEEIFKGLIPLKIAAFDSCGTVNVEIIKNWNEVRKLNCSQNYAVKSRNGGGTPTTEVLKVALEEMKLRKEEHKMIIILTDESAGCAGENLRAAIRDVRAEGVQLCGIYFETGKIGEKEKKAFYELFEWKDAIVCRPSEIGSEMLPVVRTFTKL